MVENIRNFCIIAHIDHGKSTLSDRLLEITRTVEKISKPQFLDSMELERERGITIKSHSVRMIATLGNKNYILNLIDTPGHADFSYEVSRAILSCEGAILLVDATQGIQAQTVSHLRVAKQHSLVIIPAINKIDIATGNIDILAEELCMLAGTSIDEVILVSAKTGFGVDDLLTAVIERIPPPRVYDGPGLQALIYDSYYDPYRGIVCYVRVFSGVLHSRRKLMLMSKKYPFEPEEIGYITLQRTPAECIVAGDVGYVVTGIKEPDVLRVGDTITEFDNPSPKAIFKMEEPQPVVFASLYPGTGQNIEDVRKALDKLHLNDPAFTYQPEFSKALGSGFRCGFLGTLHLEIVQERLEREFNLDIFMTTPSVSYEVELVDGTTITIQNAGYMPPQQKIKTIKEPYVRMEIFTPQQYVSDIIELCKKHRGIYIIQNYISPEHVEIVFEMPLAEILYDFYNALKSVSHGYASMHYEFIGYRPNDLVKVDILVHGEKVDPLSFLVHKDKAYEIGKAICKKLKEHIPRQLFEVAIQAAIGSKIIARETIPPLRKNVTAKCYGGDITRKRKLLERQKEGKKRLKQIGKVQIPQEAFFSILKINS